MSEPLPHQLRAGERKLLRLRELARDFRFSLGYSWRLNRGRTAAVIAVPLFESLLPAALALVLRGLVNATQRDPNAASEGYSITTYVLVSLVLSIGLVVCQSLGFYLSQANTEAIEHRLAVDLIDHSDQIDFANLERPDFQDTVSQMQTMPGHHVNEMVTKCVRAVALLITLSTLLVILSTIVPPLLVYLLILSVPYLVYRSWVAKTRYRVRVGQNRSQRWIEYYTRGVLTDESLPEVRALDLGPALLKARRRTARADRRREPTIVPPRAARLIGLQLAGGVRYQRRAAQRGESRRRRIVDSWRHRGVRRCSHRPPSLHRRLRHGDRVTALAPRARCRAANLLRHSAVATSSSPGGGAASRAPSRLDGYDRAWRPTRPAFLRSRCATSPSRTRSRKSPYSTV